MFKTEITYKNYFDVEVTETLRFNLTENEVLDLISKDPQFDPGFLAYITQDKDYPRLMDVLKKRIVASYGEVSENGKHFRKSEAIATDFVQSAAYEALKERMISGDGSEFANFVIGIFPAKFSGVLREAMGSK